jgi:hypothetical protein
MKIKKHRAWYLSMLSFLLATHFLNREKSVTEVDDWVGTVLYTYVMHDEGKKEDGEIKSEWKFKRDVQIRINVKGKNKGYAYCTEKLDNWQQQISPFVKEVKAVVVTTEKERGEGEEEVDVWVEMDKESGTYWLKTNGPRYFVRRTSRVWSSIIEMAGQPQPEDTSSRFVDGIAMDAPDQKMGKNSKELMGSYVILSTPTLHVTVSWHLRKKCPPWNNPLTQTNINTLEAKVKMAATKFIKRVNDELCIKLKVVSGKRTNAEQDELYAQGRTKPGPIVTNAKGGESNHNSGTAIDVYMVKEDGSLDIEGIVPQEVVDIASQEGFEWGGNWSKLKDYPHFEIKK